jgi:uncharacterized protein YmfQ (DUF2313 family)
MKLAIKNPDTGTWELRWTWMPMWLAMNRAVMEKVQHELNERMKALDPELSPEDLQGWATSLALEGLSQAGKNETLRKILYLMRDIKEEDE